MNRDRITQLRDHLAQLRDDQFLIMNYRLCIAGHAAKLFVPRELDEVHIHGEAQWALGLSGDQGYDLFIPTVTSGHRAHYNLPTFIRQGVDVRPKHAVQVLDHLLATGEVDWRIITP